MQMNNKLTAELKCSAVAATMRQHCSYAHRGGNCAAGAMLGRLASHGAWLQLKIALPEATFKQFVRCAVPISVSYKFPVNLQLIGQA